jgi:hypothetical protein
MDRYMVLLRARYINVAASWQFPADLNPPPEPVVLLNKAMYVLPALTTRGRSVTLSFSRGFLPV